MPDRRLRPASPGTVTWIVAPTGSRSHVAAAVAWLRTPPVARVAAIHRPSAFSTVWPTA
jgi:hypothetical protein